MITNDKQNKRPEIPKNVPSSTRMLIEKCWSQEPEERPSFAEILEYLIEVRQTI